MWEQVDLAPPLSALLYVPRHENGGGSTVLAEPLAKMKQCMDAHSASVCFRSLCAQSRSIKKAERLSLQAWVIDSRVSIQLPNRVAYNSNHFVTCYSSRTRWGSLGFFCWVCLGSLVRCTRGSSGLGSAGTLRWLGHSSMWSRGLTAPCDLFTQLLQKDALVPWLTAPKGVQEEPTRPFQRQDWECPASHSLSHLFILRSQASRSVCGRGPHKGTKASRPG